MPTAIPGHQRRSVHQELPSRGVISRHSFGLPARQWLALVTLMLLMAACDQPGGPAVTQTSLAGEWRAFEGTWTAAGTRRTLHLGPDRRAATFELTGSMLL